MRCLLLGKQDIDFDGVTGFKLFIRGDSPYVDGYVTNALWISADSPLYSKVSNFHFTDDKGNRKCIEADLVYDVYLGSKKPVLTDINIF